MTEEERAIWRAAYAVAFVNDFEASVQHWQERREERAAGPRAPTPYDRAMQNITAEGAIGVADAAVRRLRQWREREEPLAGAELGSWPKEWEPDE